MSVILAFVTANILPALGAIFVLIVPVTNSLLAFTLSSLSKFPRYIKFLRLLYEDAADESKARQTLTLGFLCLGGILSFMTYSVIPGTALPILGMVMTPIAAMLAIVTIFATFDLVFNINEGYYLKRLKQHEDEELTDLIDDLKKISEIFGKSWKNVLQTFNKLLPTLEKEIGQNQSALENLWNYINRQLEALLLYLGVQELQPITQEEKNNEEIKRQITDALAPLPKTGAALAEGVTVGGIMATGASGVASSMFVHAGVWTSIQSALGLSGGIAVGATAYTLLTVAAPLGIGALTTVGVVRGANYFRTRKEREKMSAFLADVLIAALPMLWTGESSSVSMKKEVLNRMIMNSVLIQKDRERVYQALEEPSNFDDVLRNGLLLDHQARTTEDTFSEKEKTKHRLLLCFAWQLAKADQRIDRAEIKLHDYMAKSLPTIELEALPEIRRLVTLEAGVNLEEKIVIVQDDLTAQSVDAIVNSADPSLSLNKWKQLLPFNQDNSQKVDQAVHELAGSDLAKECQMLRDCQPGEAKITEGYNLPAKKVIHTVTPIWQNGTEEETTLAACYRNSLALAEEHDLHTIAFPALGTGSGQFPLEIATKIALKEVREFLSLSFTIDRVTLVCFDSVSYQCYQQMLEKLTVQI